MFRRWLINIRRSIRPVVPDAAAALKPGMERHGIGSKITGMHAASIGCSDFRYRNGKRRTLIVCFHVMRDENQLIEAMGMPKSGSNLMEERQTWRQRSAENSPFVRLAWRAAVPGNRADRRSPDRRFSFPECRQSRSSEILPSYGSSL